MGFIYIIRNTVNDKVYIGKTIYTVEHRWYQHTQCAKRLLKDRENKNNKSIKFSYLYNAMGAIGIDKFNISPIEEVPNDIINDTEIKYISEYNSLVPNGYNLTTGGGVGYKHSEETIKLMKQRKHETIDNVRNEKLIGLPPYTAYRNNKKHGDQILINKHPLCKHKTFNVKDYDTFDLAKRAVKDFITNLEQIGIQHDKGKRESDLPSGLINTAKGYRVNKVHKGKVYDKRFERKTLTREENKKNAIEYYNSLLKSIKTP